VFGLVSVAALAAIAGAVYLPARLRLRRARGERVAAAPATV
jgi:hypothetical protein